MDDKTKDVAEHILEILKPLPPLEALRALASAAVAVGENDMARKIIGRIEYVERANASIQRCEDE